MKTLTPSIKSKTRVDRLGIKAVRSTVARLQTSAPSPKRAAANVTNGEMVRAAMLGHERVYLLRFFPKAGRVNIAGSFNNWDVSATPLKHCGKGRWVAELLLKPGRHEYRLVVDGNWTDDTFAQHRVGNPFGGQNCVLVVNSPRNGF